MTETTLEDMDWLRHRFPKTEPWGQGSSQGGGCQRPSYDTNPGTGSARRMTDTSSATEPKVRRTQLDHVREEARATRRQLSEENGIQCITTRQQRLECVYLVHVESVLLRDFSFIRDLKSL